MSWPYAYTCPLSPESPNHPLISLPTPVPLGCHRALTLGPLHHKNSHRLSVFYMVMYMFQCYSLKSSHPLLLPLSPKVYSLCLCLLCCPACRVISTIFLESILLCWYTIFVFLFLSSLCVIGSRFIHSLEWTQICSFLKLSNSPLCVCYTLNFMYPLVFSASGYRLSPIIKSCILFFTLFCYICYFVPFLSQHCSSLVLLLHLLSSNFIV